MHVVAGAIAGAVRADGEVLLQVRVHHGVRAENDDGTVVAGVAERLDTGEVRSHATRPEFFGSGVMRDVTGETQVFLCHDCTRREIMRRTGDARRGQRIHRQSQCECSESRQHDGTIHD